MSEDQDLTIIPEAVKKRRPKAVVNLYGNRKCPHCQGRKSIKLGREQQADP